MTHLNETKMVSGEEIITAINIELSQIARESAQIEHNIRE
jgi:hypothetical protein